MTLIQLEYVVAVDTHRHFATAAEKCFVTQPTLSMQIQKLEEELGVKIFDRSKQPVMPTDVGLELIAQARIVLQEANRLKEVINDQRKEITGHLRLGVIPTLAPYLVPLFLPSFLKKYPKVKITVAEQMTESIIENLKTNQLDAGILSTPLNDKAIRELPLFYEELLVYLSANNELLKKEFIDATDIDVQKLWLMQEGHCIRSQIVNLCQLRSQVKQESNFEYESGSIETLKKMIEMNAGLTILPELAVVDLPHEKQQQVKKFRSPAPVREVSVVTHRNYVKKSLIDALKHEIEAVLPKRMQEHSDQKIVPIQV